MPYTIKYGPPEDRRIRKLKIAQAIPALDELKAMGAAEITILGPDGKPVDEYYVRRAIEGLR